MTLITQEVSSPTPLPDPPNPAVDEEQEFDDKAYPYTVAQNAFGLKIQQISGEINIVSDQINVLALEINDNATNAANSAITAQTAATTAVDASGATIWTAVDGGGVPIIYQAGDLVWSSIDGRTWRRKTTGTSAVDPAIDPTDWFPIGFTLADLHAIALYF